MTDCFALNDGNFIPVQGLGTHKVDENGTSMQTVVECALEAGYRMFDTAAGYGNEDRLGSALANASVDRRELYLVTKLDDPDHSRERAERSIERALKRLQTDYIDLFLIHSPNSPRLCVSAAELGHPDPENAWGELNAEAWEVMERYHRQGVLKSIGVSNFRMHHLQRLLQTANVVPAANQIKTCPGSLGANRSLERFCSNHRIRLMGYSPFGHGLALQRPEILAIAETHRKIPAQILLRYLYECGVVSIARASSLPHMLENRSIDQFTLSDEEKTALEQLRLEDRWAMIRDPDTGTRYNRE